VTAEELRALVKQGEGDTLEFKQRLPRDRTALANLLTGFANAQGGNLVVGYSEPTGRFVGVDDREKAAERLKTALEHIEPRLDVQSEFVAVDDGEALVVEVQSGEQHLYSADGIAAIRKGTEVVPIRSEEIVSRAAESDEQLASHPFFKELAEKFEDNNRKLDKVEKRGRLRRTVPITMGGVVGGYLLRALDPISSLPF
jgi:predicted HTH transcriptional regulator